MSKLSLKEWIKMETEILLWKNSLILLEIISCYISHMKKLNNFLNT